MLDAAAARQHLVDSQLRPSRVLDDRILDAMGTVPRELFVPARLRDVAYVDGDLEIAPGRYLMEPVVFARLLQEAGIGPDDVVLDVGCATGYSAAVLSRLAATVVALEESPEFRVAATETLSRLGVDNVALVEGWHAEGDAAHGPYDVIVLGGAAERPPHDLQLQLAAGGRPRLRPPDAGGGQGHHRRARRNGEVFGAREVFDAATPVLPGFAAELGFVF